MSQYIKNNWTPEDEKKLLEAEERYLRLKRRKEHTKRINANEPPGWHSSGKSNLKAYFNK